MGLVFNGLGVFCCFGCSDLGVYIFVEVLGVFVWSSWFFGVGVVGVVFWVWVWFWGYCDEGWVVGCLEFLFVLGYLLFGVGGGLFCGGLVWFWVGFDFVVLWRGFFFEYGLVVGIVVWWWLLLFYVDDFGFVFVVVVWVSVVVYVVVCVRLVGYCVFFVV